MSQILPVILLSLLVLPPLVRSAEQTSARERALQWLAAYRKEQLLFHPADLEALEDRLSGMTQEEAVAWLDQTGRLRDRLESPAWQQTRDWYRRYFAAQRDRGATQLTRLRDRSVRMSAVELERVVEKITAFRLSLSQRRQAAEETLRVQRADRRLKGVSSTGFHQPQPAPLPSPPRVTDAGRCLYPPLIDSREVARRVLWHALWGRRRKDLDKFDHALRASATR